MRTNGIALRRCWSRIQRRLGRHDSSKRALSSPLASTNLAAVGSFPFAFVISFTLAIKPNREQNNYRVGFPMLYGDYRSV